MTRLAALREQLAGLRRRRNSVRLATAYFALAVTVLWVLICIFVLDWQLSMLWQQRLIAIAIGVGAAIWAYRRYCRPLLGVRETDLDVALMVERQQEIDSDLVAAIQFESPEASRWGSAQLERAVIDYVAEFSRGWEFLEGLSVKQLVRRGVILAVTVLLVAVCCFLFPQHVGIFLARLAMSSQHYPTRTQIDSVELNGNPVVVRDAYRAGYGQPVSFSVHVSGEVPADVKRIDLRSSVSGESRPIELVRDTKAPEEQVIFKGNLPQLVDSLVYQVYLGDAWTEPGELIVIPLPVVETKLTPTPPSYARSAAEVEQTAGTRQLAVLEGSRVDLEISCENKGLSAASLTVDKKQYPLMKQDDDGRRWALPAKDSPLARIDSPVKYEVQVTDQDGLHLPHPIEGYIRIKADRPPTVLASVDVQYFLPNGGVPEVNYTANDDYGLSQLRLYVEVIHPAASMAAYRIEPLDYLIINVTGTLHDQPIVGTYAVEPGGTVNLGPDYGRIKVSGLTLEEAAETIVKQLGQILKQPQVSVAFAPKAIPLETERLAKPVLKPKLPLSGTYRLPLEQFKLAKGDQVRLTVEAVDYRGDDPGKPTMSEPVVLQITDESGIMAALTETDQRAYAGLNGLIERQSQAGGLK